MNQCGSSCRMVECRTSVALPSIQLIMTVVLRRKLNVKLLPLISVKWSANYIQKQESPATVLICHFLFSVWPMKIKEDIHLEWPLPFPSSSSLQSFLTVKGGVKLETCLMNTGLPLCVTVSPLRLKTDDLHLAWVNKDLKIGTLKASDKKKQHVSVTRPKQNHHYSKQAPSVTVICCVKLI